MASHQPPKKVQGQERVSKRLDMQEKYWMANGASASIRNITWIAFLHNLCIRVSISSDVCCCKHVHFSKSRVSLGKSSSCSEYHLHDAKEAFKK
eukprot:c41335_g1_i1 orf=1-279(-)